MKKAIVGVLSKPGVNRSRHGTGYIEYLKSLFDADTCREPKNFNKYDALYITNGVNYRPGSYNIIGGVNSYHQEVLDELDVFDGPIYCIEPFSIVHFADKRGLDYVSGNDAILADIPECDNVVCGDSHSLSVYPGKGWEIIRKDGKTLYGWLKHDHSYLNGYKKKILYFGNIDIRFHLARQQNPYKATNELVQRYLEVADKYDAWVVEPLPIEDPMRKIPKSGMYKGQPFYGSWQERADIREAFCAAMLAYNKILTWPRDIYNEFNELDFSAMEAVGSVHLRPTHYMPEICPYTKEILNA